VKIPRQPIRASLKAQAKAVAAEVQNKWLSTQRKPLEEVVPHRLIRWLLRRLFEHYGFACRSHTCNNEDGKHGTGSTVECPNCATPVVVLCDGKCYASIEYRGVFDRKSDAYWLSNGNGGALKPIPYNVALPPQTVQYQGGEETPGSEAADYYRRGVPLPYEAILRSDLDKLGRKINDVADCAEGSCPKAV
jgi:hypothetical protein